MSTAALTTRRTTKLPSMSEVALVPMEPWHGPHIPKIIHQTYSTNDIPDAYKANISKLKYDNKGWSYCFYNDEDVLRYISDNYGAAILNRFNLISSKYGAAKADLFRYLLMYKEGGVYLDIKSGFSSPIDDILTGEEGYIISEWSNKPGEEHENLGIHPEYSNIEFSEFQQWHIICAPGHPFLKAVLERVLHNIDEYTPLKFGVGKLGVLRLTGPIAYTLAIAPLVHRYPCKRIINEKALNLQYSVTVDRAHEIILQDHYSKSVSPIVHATGLKKLIANIYSFAKATQKTYFPSSSISLRYFKKFVVR